MESRRSKVARDNEKSSNRRNKDAAHHTSRLGSNHYSVHYYTTLDWNMGGNRNGFASDGDDDVPQQWERSKAIPLAAARPAVFLSTDFS
jgi:hypothetical protein